MIEGFGHPSKEIKGTKGSLLEGKKVALCVTGSVSLYLAPEIAREIMRNGAEVFTVMSPSAQRLLSPELMRWATGNDVVTELTGALEHVTLGGRKGVDVVLVAPATANTIAKLASGISDTNVTATVITAMGSGIPVVLVPAMHEPIYENILVKEALSKLKGLGVKVVEPRVEEGKAKIAAVEHVVDLVVRMVNPKKDLERKNVVVTAGATVEFIDPIRVITNLSSGKMGIALARAAYLRGAEVKLIYGRGTVTPPPYLNRIDVTTTEEMMDALVEAAYQEPDMLISAAAVADYKPEMKISHKISTKEEPSVDLRLVTTPKLIKKFREVSKRSLIIAFKAEYNLSDELLEESAKELMDYVDVVFVNDVSRDGFGSDLNSGIIIDKKGRKLKVPLRRKEDVANILLDFVLPLIYD